MNDLHALYRRLQVPVSRRAMLRASAGGFGFLGLAGLLAEESGLLASSSGNPLAERPPHFKPRAKRVIFLFMHGGPSGIDILDPKERLTRDHGKPLPIERPLAFDDENPAARGAKRASRQRSLPPRPRLCRRSLRDPIHGRGGR